MKAILTIRGNLVLINIVVIGLILWLAISFLHIAITQRNDALRMRGNIATERTIFQTNKTLAHERALFFDYLQANGSPNTEQVAQLNAASLDSDVMLSKMIAEITQDTVKDTVFDHMPTTRSVLREQLDKLQRNTAELADYRKQSLAQFRLPANLRDNSVSALFEHQTDIIESVVNIARNLKYLPNTDSAAIAHYNELINKVLVLNVDLARMSTAINQRVMTDASAMADKRVQVAVLNEQIERQLDQLFLAVQATDNSSQATLLSIEARRVYQENYLQISERFDVDTSSQKRDEISVSNLRMVLVYVSTITTQLADTTHSSIEVLVEEYASRANRNFVIDSLLVILCFAISLASVALNRRIKRNAYHDRLTRLHNRLSFETALQEFSMLGSQTQAVIFIDLDRFKSVNDNYGHALGDELLLEVASRLEQVCGRKHMLARLGGDEFALFVSDVSSEAQIEKMASDMVDAIKNNYDIRDLSLNIGASAGVSISPLDCKCGIEMLRNAEIAMYHSKATKVSGVFRFNQAMADSYRERLQLEADLRKGIENNEFQVVYQPKVCTDSGLVKSVEALLRWSHPERGFVSPAQFIPVAEDNGLMGAIGHWVLNEACREIALLQSTTHQRMQVAINISAQQFGDDGFVDNVFGALDKHGINPECLELEVTESIVMTDVERVIAMLKRLKESGISIAIDDFGTGYSSLQYLQKLPLNTLKIDRAFITELDNHDPDNSVANSIVQLAKLFNLETVAEGVETVDQDLKTRSLGVHHIQGYLYSKPVSAKELPAVIDQLSEQEAQRRSYHAKRAA